MNLMKSGQRGHVMPGGDRPFSMSLTLCLPQNPAGGKAWPLANWCILLGFFKLFQTPVIRVNRSLCMSAN